MKRMISKLPSLLLAAALAAGMAGTALADVVYKDRDLSVQGAGEYTLTDLFDNFKGIMPGDKLDQPVMVRNESDKAIKVYLRAEAHDEASNPLTYNEPAAEGAAKEEQVPDVSASASAAAAQRSESVATMQDFLAQLNLKVTAGDSVVFDASPDLEAQLADNVLLGEVPAGESLQIGAHLTVPIEMDNTYAHRTGEVDWVFTIEEVEEPTPTPMPGDSDSATPLSKTGDAAPLLLASVLACAAGVVAAVAFAKSRKRKQR